MDDFEGGSRRRRRALVPEAIAATFNYSVLCAPGDSACGFQVGSSTEVAVQQRMNDVLDAFPLESTQPCFSVATGYDEACLAALALEAYEVRQSLTAWSTCTAAWVCVGLFGFGRCALYPSAS